MKHLSLIENVKTFRGEWFAKTLPGHLHFIFGLAEGIIPLIHRRFGYGFGRAVCFVQRDVITWFWEQRSLERMRHILIDRTIHDERYVSNFVRLWDRDRDRFLKLAEEISRTDLRALTDEELSRLYYRLYGVYNWALSVGQQTDALLGSGEGDWFFVMLKKEVRGVSDPELRRIFAGVSLPVDNSFARQEHLDLLRLAGSIEGHRPLKRYLVTHRADEGLRRLARYPTLLKHLERHAQRFYWTGNNYEHVFAFTPRHYLANVRALLREGQSVRQRYEEERRRIGRNRRIKHHLIRHFRLNKKVGAVIQLSDACARIHDEKKGIILRNNHCLHLFLAETSRRTGIPLRELFYSTAYEFHDVVCERRFYRRLWRERQRGCAFIYTKQKHAVISGPLLHQLDFDAMIGTTHATVLKGVGASPGRVIGRVRVITSDKEFSSMRRGEILITNNTTPEFVPLMRKAIAVVTEQGGMTTHAAIVSRELGVPCVIGVKNVTRICRTGERIEVDAINGTIIKV